MTTFRVLITGSRTWTNRRAIFDRLDALHREHGNRLVIVHGACPHGADATAALWAEHRGVAQDPHPANWRDCDPNCRPGHRKHRRDGTTYCPSAGHRRNAEMVATRPDLCLAFIRDHSSGATGCHAIARRAGISTPDPITPTTPEDT